MKLSTSAIAIMATLISTATLAESSKPLVSDRVFGSAFAEYYFPDADKSTTSEWSYVKRGYGYGLEVGYNLDETWALRAEFARQHLKQQFSDDKLVGKRVGIDALYNLAGTSAYFVGGLKHLDIDTTDDATALNVGIGYRKYLTENFSVFGEMNRFQGISETSNWVCLYCLVMHL